MLNGRCDKRSIRRIVACAKPRSRNAVTVALVSSNSNSSRRRRGGSVRRRDADIIWTERREQKIKSAVPKL